MIRLPLPGARRKGPEENAPANGFGGAYAKFTHSTRRPDCPEMDCQVRCMLLDGSGETR